MTRQTSSRLGFGRQFSPKRRSSTTAPVESGAARRQARVKRWRERFRRLSLSSFQSSRIVQGVCDLFRSGAEAARAVHAATGSHVVGMGYGNRQLRMESLESRQMLTATPFTGMYVQNFDTLSNDVASTTNELTLAGWELFEYGGGTRDNGKYAVDHGESEIGDIYSYGAAGSTDRALGSVLDGLLIPTFGILFVNNTGAPITSLNVSYFGEQWRFGRLGRDVPDRLDFQFSTDSLILADGTWTDFDTLDFTGPNDGHFPGPRDGNDSNYRTHVTDTITGLNVADGETIFLRWMDINALGADDGLAIDDLVISIPTSSVAPTSDAGDPVFSRVGESFVLDGTRSTDDGTIAKYTWHQVSGPLAYTGTVLSDGSVDWDDDNDGLTDFNTPDAKLTIPAGTLPVGNYQFELTVVDNDRLSSVADVVDVTVVPDSVVIGDLDGDGRAETAEIVLPTGGGTTALNLGSGGAGGSGKVAMQDVHFTMSVGGTLRIIGSQGSDTLLITGEPDFDLLNVEYDGGEGDDELSLSLNYSKIEFRYTNASDGDVLFKDGLDNTRLNITYTGLEPITNTGVGADAVFELPTGMDDAVLEDDGMGGFRLRSANNTFEVTNLPAPINSLTINGGPGDTLLVTKDLSVASSIALNVPTVTLNANLTAASISGAADAVTVQSNAAQIADAIAIANAGATISMGAGTYDEEVLLNKAGLKLIGAGADSTTIRGVIGGNTATVRIAASNVEVAGLTITRLGNNPADWNNSALKLAGIAIQGQSITGAVIRDNVITGNRTAIDVNNSNGHTIRNNDITDNRTGLFFRNQTDNLTVVENNITNNWTVGILFLDASGGDNSPIQQALGSTFTNNNISGNWFGGVVDRQAGGTLPAPGTNLKDFSGNWFGSASPVITTDDSSEPGYAAQIPVAFGGTATNPGGAPDILGPASANIDISPWLLSGVDINPSEFGFQGDFSDLQVTPDGPQTGGLNRIDEAISLATSGGTVRIPTGTYTGDVDSSQPGESVVLVPGSSPGTVTIVGNWTLDSDDTVAIEINGTTPGTDYDQFLVSGGAALGSATLTVSGSYVPQAGDSFTIVDAASVSGVFVTAPFTLNGVPLEADYSTGDVVLTAETPAEVWVDDDWEIIVDVGPAGFSYGDVVESDADDGDDLVTGKIFGYNAFDLIQDAVNAVEVGGTVHVLAGTYVESLALADDVTITGQGDALTLIDANGAFVGISVSVGASADISGIGLSNFSSTGIQVEGDLVLAGSTVSGGFTGIWVNGAGTLNMTSSVVEGAQIFGVQVSATTGGAVDVMIDSSEIGGAASSAAAVGVSSGEAAIQGSILADSQRGLLVNGSGAASIHGSALATSLTLRGVENATANIVDASGNWWGTNVEANVIAKTLGLVDFTPFLHNNETDTARGFTADNSHLHVSAAVVSAQTSGNRIQEAIGLVDPSGTVIVHDGAYDETVLINKSLTLESFNQHGAVIAPTSGSQQTVVTANATDVTIDGFAIQMNQNDDAGLAGTAPIAPVGIGAVGTLMDGLTISNNQITSIGDNASVIWTGSPGLTVHAAGIVLNDAPSGGIPSVTITGNNVSIRSGSSFYQRAVWLSQLNADITGNTLAGVANDLNFQFASGGPSLIEGNNFIGAHITGGGGVVIADPNANSNITIHDNDFTPQAHPFSTTSLQVNRNASNSTIEIDGNRFNGHTIGVDVGGAGGVTVSNNEFTSEEGITGFLHVVVDSQNASNNASTATAIDTKIFGNTFNVATGAIGNAIVLEDNLAGSTYTTTGVEIGVTADNTYGNGLSAGIRMLGGVATIEDTIGGADTGLIVAGGAATVASSTFTGNDTGIAVTGGSATITGSDISNNGVGILFADGGNGTVGGGTAAEGNNFDDGTPGDTDDDNDIDIRIATDAGAVAIAGNNQFAGDTYYIENQSSTSHDISGAGNSFDEIGADANFRIEDKMHHKVDDLSSGLVTWVANSVYVTTPGGGSTDSNIQRAIDAVPSAPGWTVNVEDGTYIEQVLINKDLTLVGESQAGTIVQAPAVLDTGIGFNYGGSRQSVITVTGGDVNIENLTVDGAGAAASAAFDFHGIGIHNADVTIDGVAVTRVRTGGPGGTFNGAQRGRAIFVGNDTGTHTVTVSNSVISDYQKNGIDIRGAGVTADITGNIITGAGPTGVIAQNGIVILGGAVGNISGNTVEDHEYTGSGASSAGILLYGASAGTVVSNNLNINDNQLGIALDNSTSGATISGNTVTGSNSAGISVNGGSALIEGNTVRGSDGNQVGIRVQGSAIVDAGSDNTDGDPTGLGNSAGGNILTGYTGTGGNYAIQNLNTDVPGNVDVYARHNSFGTAVAAGIELVVFHTADDPQYTEVFFTPAENPPGQTPPPTVVYVDDDWDDTAIGVDADASGGTLGDGQAFGYDQFATIQDAIDAVAAGGTIWVYAGSYVENLSIPKALELFGVNYAFAGNDSGRGSEAVITAAAATNAMIEVSADNVEIAGFTIEGIDDVLRGVRVNGVNDVEIRNNIIAAIEGRAIQYNGAALGNTGGVVEDNLITDLVSGGALGLTYGVVAFDASYVAVKNNVMTGLDVGVYEQYFYQPNGIGNAANEISGNNITAAVLGYGTNERATQAATTELSNNVYTIGAGGVGVQLYNIYKSGGISLTNETITGADVGVYAYVNGGSVSIANSTITGTDSADSIGVHVTNYLEAFNSYATAFSNTPSALTISGSDISNFQTGVLVEDADGDFAGNGPGDDATGAVSVTVTNNTNIFDTDTGILVSGPSAQATITGNNASIHGNAIGIDVDGGSASITDNRIYDNSVAGIRVTNGGTVTALSDIEFADADDIDPDNAVDVLLTSTAGAVAFGNDLNFQGDTFFIDNEDDQDIDLSSLTGISFDELDNFRIEDKMHHRIDTDLLLSNGLITWVANNVFVTDAGTDHSIQRGIEAAAANDTVNIEGGSYSENVLIAKDINLLGHGTVNWTSAVVNSSLITIDDDNFGGDDQSVSVENIDFDGASGTVGYGIRVLNTADFENLTVTDSSFTGFAFNAVAVFGNGTTGTSAQSVDISNSTFTDNGLAGGGGSGDLQFFLYNGDAALSNLDLSNTGAGLDAHIGIQFRGVGDQDGTNQLAMGEISLTDIDISGLYVRSMIGLQRYATSNITFNDVRLGGSGSEITGTFGAALRIDSVGGGTIASPTTMDLNDTHFRGVGGLGLDIEVAPDGYGFLRIDATETRWDTTGSTSETPDNLSLAEQYEIENRILHYVDGEHPTHGAFDGFVETVDGEAFITTAQLGSIQRGVNVVDANGIVHVDAGTYAENVNVNRSVTIDGDGTSTIIDAGGANGLSIQADDVTIRDLRVTNAAVGVQFATTVDNTDLLGIQVDAAQQGIHIQGTVTDLTLDGVTLTGNVTGMRVATLGSVVGLDILNSHFDGNQYGATIYASNSITDNETRFTDVLIKDSTFNNNDTKGLYFEKLDNAVLENVTVDNSGHTGSFGAGIDINLKHGTYSSIDILGGSITNSGTGDPVNGAGLMIKARGTGNDPSYSANPATLSGVVVDGMAFDGNQIGIRVGEPGRDNTEPNAVLIDDVTVENSVVIGIDVLGGVVTVQNSELLNNDTGVRVVGAGKATIAGNTDGISGGDVGIDVDGGTALVEGTDLNGNTIGVRIQNGGIADLGQTGAGSDFTGLGISTGGNDFSLYTTAATASAGAIVNLNTNGDNALLGRQGAPWDVTAAGNIWAAPADPNSIENVVHHDSDSSALGFVDFAAFGNLVVSLDDDTVVTNQDIDEGSQVEVTGSFSNVPQAHKVTITWGDGSPDTVLNLSAGDFDFSAAHTYEDDADGPAENTTNYPITVTVTEIATAEFVDDASLSVDVSNVAPTVTLNGPTSAIDGQTLGFTFTTFDPGADTFQNLVISGGAHGVVSNIVFDSNTGAGSFDVTFDGPPGNNPSTVSVILEDDDAASGSDSIIVTVSDTLRVIAFQQNPSGFDITFNRALSLAELNLYDGNDAAVDVPDLTLVGASVGNVRGSMVWNAATNTLSFVKTGGPLAADAYTLTLKSGADAFQDTFGNKLDGDGDHNDLEPGDDFTNVFVVSPPAARIVSVRDIARGPGQAIDDVPENADSRLAIRVNDSTNLRSMDFWFHYDTSLFGTLTAANVSLADSIVPGLASWSIFVDASTAGILKVTTNGANALPAGTDVSIVLIDVTIPNTALYGASQVMRLTNTAINVQSGALSVSVPSIGDHGIHKNVYLGDAAINLPVDANVYDGFDAALIQRVTTGTDSGFDDHDWTDPVIVVDADRDGIVDGGDSSILAQYLLGFPTPQIPGPVLSPSQLLQVTSGADPLLSIEDDFEIASGVVHTIPVTITIEPSTTVLSATFDVTYDDSVMDFAGAVRGVDFPSVTWSFGFNEPSPGTVKFVIFSASGITTGGSPQTLEIAKLTFNVPWIAPAGESPLDIIKENPNEGGLVWTVDSGSVIINPTVGGDYNVDGNVDAADYVVWRKLENTTVPNHIVPDGSGNGQVDAADYDVWTQNFGTAASGSGGAATDTDGEIAQTLLAISTPPIIVESQNSLSAQAVSVQSDDRAIASNIRLTAQDEALTYFGGSASSAKKSSPLDADNAVALNNGRDYASELLFLDQVIESDETASSEADLIWSEWDLEQDSSIDEGGMGLEDELEVASIM